ncbi:MAG: hypothetical protein ACI81W_000867, partial [Saprospiraceae bacterium]
MKNIILLFVLFFFVNISFAQGVEIEPKHQYQHELGLDLSSLVDRFFLKAANNAFQRDYILTYK